MPFQPGHTFSPPGKSEQRIFGRALNQALEIKGKGDKMDALRSIASKLVDLAIKGEQWAVKEVADRLDGKSLQMIEVKKADPFEDITADDVTRLRERIVGARAVTLDQNPGPRAEVSETRAIQTISKATRIP